MQLASFDSGLLADVEHALAKIEAGTYGVSEDSGAPIPLSRLRAVPWARRPLEEAGAPRGADGLSRTIPACAVSNAC